MKVEFLLIFGAVLVIVSLFSIAIQQNRRKQDKQLRVFKSFGFRSIESVTTLTDRVNQLYSWKQSETRHTLRNVYHKTISNGDMYFFKFEDSDSDHFYLAILSSELNLPQFFIYPKLEVGGIAGNVLNKALLWAISKIGTTIDFPQDSRFQDEYIVNALNPSAVRQFLTADVLRQISQLKGIAVQAEGSLLLFFQLNESGSISQEFISQQVNQAVRVLQIFASDDEYLFS